MNETVLMLKVALTAMTAVAVVATLFGLVVIGVDRQSLPEAAKCAGLSAAMAVLTWYAWSI